MKLLLFGNQVFFAGFLGLVFGAALLFPAAFGASLEVFGRPLAPASRIASRSASRYNPAEPIYRNGFISFRSNLLLAATDEMPRVWAISNTVRNLFSIHKSIYRKLPQKQSLKVENYRHFDIIVKIVIIPVILTKINKMSKHIDILLYKRIAKEQKNLKVFGQTLDGLHGWRYI
jgi:hypothetical protein